MENIRTINGIPASEMLEKLRNLLQLEDYEKLENGDLYISESKLRRKFLSLVGFNHTIEPIPCNSEGSFVEVRDIEGKKTVVTASRLLLLYDDGCVATSVSKLGVSEIAMKRDGSGPVSVEATIKSAETDSFKRAIFSLCPKPEGYDEAKERSKGNKSNGQGGDNSSYSLKEFTITAAANLLNNGMITMKVKDGDNIMDVVMFSKKVGAESSKANITPQAYAARLQAGVSVKASVKADTYNGKARYVAQKFEVMSNTTTSQQTSAGHSNTAVSDNKFCGEITVADIAKPDENRNIFVQIRDANNNLRYLLISYAKAVELAGQCKISYEQLVKGFSPNQKYFIDAFVNSGGVLELASIKNNRRKEGVA